MPTVILVGFESFGRYKENPTETLARDLYGAEVAGYKIRSLVFPAAVLWSGQRQNHGQEVVETALATNASLILGLGMASEARGLKIEMRCWNWLENDVYCTEFENRQPVLPNRAPHQPRHMPLKGWNFAALSHELSAVGVRLALSVDPGRYCCNALMLQVLQACDDRGVQLPFLFAHVPCTERAVAAMPDFDRKKKILIRQQQLPLIVEKILQSYCYSAAFTPHA